MLVTECVVQLTLTVGKNISPKSVEMFYLLINELFIFRIFPRVKSILLWRLNSIHYYFVFGKPSDTLIQVLFVYDTRPKSRQRPFTDYGLTPT